MDEKDIIKTDGELSQPGEKDKKGGKKALSLILNVFFILLFTVVLSISGQVTYDYVRYQSFFVNGESMYPTLNADVSFTEENGTYHDGSASDSLGLTYTWGNFDGTFRGHSGVLHGTYVCDYGLMDSKSGFVERIKRFDIVVTYFDNEFTNGVLSSLASMKIKRVLALPGESFYFDAAGEFYVKNPTSGDYEKKEQTFLDAIELNHPGWKKATVTNFPVTYRDSEGTKTYLAVNTPYTLTGDEYFVVGDNRLKDGSSDSRVYANGPVSKTSLIGKAMTISAKCSYNLPSSGTVSWKPLFNTFKMPWQLRSLNG
jgi:signal peptidase I